MRSASSFAAALLCAYCLTAQGQTTTPATAPAPLPSPEMIASHFHAGMSPEEAKSTIAHLLPGLQPTSQGWAAGLGEYLRYPVAPDVILLIEITNIRDPNAGPRNQVTAARIYRFDDLAGQFPPELFPAVKAIHHAPKILGYDFDPAALIKTVNYLRPLGKEKVLKALRAYEALTNADMIREIQYDLDAQRIFYISRLLFVRTDSKANMPWMFIGAPTTDVQQGNPDWPLFPLVLENDIPFCPNAGFSLGGQPEPPSRHLNYCEKNCIIREQPLNPSSSPLIAAEQLFNSNKWHTLFPQTGYAESGARGLIRTQAIRSLSNVVPNDATPRVRESFFGDQAEADKRWQATMELFKSKQLSWNEESASFQVK